MPAQPGLEEAEERLRRPRFPRQGPQHIEDDDVARALPYGHHRLFAVAPGQRERLRIPVAAEAFEGLIGVFGAAFADPVLADRRGQPPEVRGIGALIVIGGCQVQ